MSKESLPLSFDSKSERQTGIQHIGISTAGWLFDPEVLFRHLDTVNEERARENKSLLVAEVYPTIRPKRLDLVAEVTGLLPPTVDADYLSRRLRTYPGVVIKNVHLEFNFSRQEELIRTIVGEDLLPRVPGNKFTDRLAMGMKQRAFQANWMITMGPARNKRGVEMARELGVGVSGHANVIEGFGQEGELDEIKNTIPHVLVETERPYNYSPHLRRLMKKGISRREVVSNPKIILKELVQRYRLDGLVYGADHALQTGNDLAFEYGEVAESVRMVHVSGSEVKSVHTVIGLDNTGLNRLIDKAAFSEHWGDLTVILDLNPLVVRGIKEEGQLNMIRNYVRWIEMASKQ